MTSRERLLAALVAVALLVLVGSFGIRKVLGLFEQRHQTIAQLELTVNKKKLILIKGKKARRTLAVYQQRSLPSDPVLASSRYRAWLHDWAERSGIESENVKYVSARRFGSDYIEFSFSLVCQADLQKMVRLLYDFYSVDYLHRIERMSAKPLKNNRLALKFAITALALTDAPKDRTLGELPANRLALSDVDKYLEVIVNRNPYSPANKPPEFVSTDTERGYINQPMTIKPRVRDPEDNRVTYELGKTELTGLSIDPQSGKIEWTPDRKGEFEVLVYATDDGLPPRKTSTTIKMVVTDPPPPEKPKPVPPSFDEAKFAFVSGIVEVNGQWQVWVTSRTDGKLVKLRQGDSFQIGLMKGAIEQINPRYVDIRVEGKLRRVRFGESLAGDT